MLFNFGSINIDHVYQVTNLPNPGETIAATRYSKFLGGKGINQSIAAQSTGCETRHYGAVGPDGEWALRHIEQFGVSTKNIMQLEQPTGHAIIFVDENAENQIVIEGGANQRLSKSMISDALDSGNPDNDWVLLQNETNLTEEIVELSKSKGFRVAYAAAPFIPEVAGSLAGKVDLFAVNEIEAGQLAKALSTGIANLPVNQLLMTKGSSGVEIISGGETIFQPAFPVEAIDTTGAGDTFLGSFLGSYAQYNDIKGALRYAAAASAIQVTRPGAATAIPSRNEVEAFLQSQMVHDG